MSGFLPPALRIKVPEFRIFGALWMNSRGVIARAREPQCSWCNWAAKWHAAREPPEPTAMSGI
jgi:hypothetical protein